jgi:hypothetical protein
MYVISLNMKHENFLYFFFHARISIEKSLTFDWLSEIIIFARKRSSKFSEQNDIPNGRIFGWMNTDFHQFNLVWKRFENPSSTPHLIQKSTSRYFKNFSLYIFWAKEHWMSYLKSNFIVLTNPKKSHNQKIH